jgi:hypothetical protein
MQALKFGERKNFALSAFFLGLYCFRMSQLNFVSVPVCFLNGSKLENPWRISDGTQFIGQTAKAPRLA